MKTGLIVEGGGMKCAYSAGVLDGFLDGKIAFDYVIGVSAGAANAASYLAGQRDRNHRFYTEHSKSPQYFGVKSFLTTGNLFGLDYIYGTLTEEGGGDPLDYDAMQKNPAEFEYPATDAETGKPVYFTKADVSPHDYAAIKATCALPVASKPVEISGRFYYDGGVSDSIPVGRALKKGCDRVVVLMSKPKGFRMEPQGQKAAYTLALHRYPKIVSALDHRHEVYNAQLDEVHRLEEEGRCMVFCPPNIASMGTYSVDTKLAEMLYKSGLYDYNESAQTLKDFIGGKV